MTTFRVTESSFGLMALLGERLEYKQRDEADPYLSSPDGRPPFDRPGLSYSIQRAEELLRWLDGQAASAAKLGAPVAHWIEQREQLAIEIEAAKIRRGDFERTLKAHRGANVS